MQNPVMIRRAMITLVLLSLIIRGFLAAYLEFGNDEVYYWTYALYPGLSHFDHPPMVGFLIQLTTLNLLVDSEFFIRLGAVLLGTFNIWLVYLIGKTLKDELTGFYAAMLYTGSLYAFIIAGTFILPDTPQLTFWLLAVLFMLRSIGGEVSRKAKAHLVLAGLAIGLASLSKYTSVFLLFGAFMYLLLYQRKWFRIKELYVAMMLALVLFIPVIIWNVQHEFISFTYQGERVGFLQSGLRADYFFTELAGQFFYNNPVNFIVGLLALVAVFRGKLNLDSNHSALLVWISLPLILIFLFFSLFRQTLPHWTGPAWTTIILLSAVYIRDSGLKRNKVKLVPGAVAGSLGLMMLVISLGVMQIKGGILYYDPGNKAENIGEKDVSLDMFGWRQLSEEFARIVEKEKTLNNIDPYSPVISHRWFPAANIDYYLASPLGIDVLGLGSLDAIHKYAWITTDRGGFDKGMDAWYITVSRDFRDPVPMYGKYFSEVELAHVKPIFRNDRHVMNAYFYYLVDMTLVPADPLTRTSNQQPVTSNQ